MKIPRIVIKTLRQPIPQTLQLLFSSKKFLSKSKLNLNFRDQSSSKDYTNESSKGSRLSWTKLQLYALSFYVLWSWSQTVKR